ncbi:MAG TPA: hypothetical protein EYP58_04180 [bacterium (Candidatus Stahlbacteria)]|nr:hypothetical protein [Candidatus Stahlbacteria bacterium]
MEREINLLRRNISRLVENEIKPKVKDWEKEGKVPNEIVSKLAELGMFGLIIPEDYGGIGYGAQVLTAAVEELTRGSSSIALLVLLQNSLVAQTLIKAKRKDLLEKLAEGQILGGGGIFDKDFIQKDGRLNGEGDFLVNGQGNIFAIWTKKDAFLVEAGLELNHCHEVLALHAADICSFSMKGVPISYSAPIEQLKAGMNLYLTGISAIALGIVREILNEAKTYAQNRKQFGRPIGDFWMVQDMLAEIAITVRTGELLVGDVALRYDQGNVSDHDPAMAKVFVTRQVMKAATLGIQIFGGYGYTTDYPMERYFREAKVLEVIGNVNEELRSQIARSL